MISFRPLAEIKSGSAILTKDRELGIWIDEGETGSIIVFRSQAIPMLARPWPEIESINEISRRTRNVIDLGQVFLDIDEQEHYSERTVRSLDAGDLVLHKSGPCITMQKTDRGLREFWLRFGADECEQTPVFVELTSGIVEDKWPVFQNWRLLRKRNLDQELVVIYEHKPWTR